MDNNFLRCIIPILYWETDRYTDSPGDLGGATKYGVRQRTLAMHRNTVVSKDDVRNLTLEEAQEIYYKLFWLPNDCDKLPLPLALLLFDGAVNQRVTDIRKFMQEALGVVADGVFGPKTLAAAKNCNILAVIKEFMALRAVKYSKSKTVAVHGHGWYRRMFDMYQRALNMCNETKGN